MGEMNAFCAFPSLMIQKTDKTRQTGRVLSCLAIANNPFRFYSVTELAFHVSGK